MRRLFTVLAALVLAVAAGAQTLEGTFVQVKTIKASGRSFTSNGTLVYTSPDQLQMLFTQPDGDYLIIDGPYLRSDLNGTAMDVDTARNAQMRNLKNTLLNCIAGDVEKVAAENDADLSSASTPGGGRKVTLVARKQAPRGYSRIVLEYRKDGILTSMILEEFSGVVTDMKISDIKKH